MGRPVREPAACGSTPLGHPGAGDGDDAHFPHHRHQILPAGLAHLGGRAVGDARWSDFAAPHGTESQCRERRWLHRAVWRRGTKRHHHGLESQSHAKVGIGIARGDHAGCHRAPAAGADDRHRRDLGNVAGRHSYGCRQRRAARDCHRGGRRPGDIHRSHLICAALDVSRHRALGRAAPRRSAVGPMRLHRLIAVALGVAVSACAVGPHFKRATPPAATGDGSASQAQITATESAGGDTQHFVAGMDIPNQWWTLFKSPQLNLLVEQALKANPDVGAAQAALRQAPELYLAQWTSFFPVVDGNFAGTRAKNAVGTIANPTNLPQTNPYYNLFTAQLTVSYLPDVFGGTRRSVEAAKAQAESDRFQLEATYVTLSSNVVVTAVQEASLRGQIAATQRLLELQHQLTETVQRQRTLGTASDLDLLAQQSAEAQTAQTLPPLQKQLGQTRDALTALLGRLPSEEPEETFRLEQLTLPVDLPVSLPSKLVEQRPDVRQAEENLHAASAAVGIALADMLPQFSINGDLGSSALKLGQLFTPYTGFWDVGASLTQTLFDAGALLHKKRAADAALDEAAAQYRGAVILACQNVADTLRALQADADALKASGEAERAAKRTFDLAQRQRELGTISVVAVLIAEQAYQQAELALVQAQANRYSDTAGLFQSLGGGWWNRRGKKLGM